MSPDRQEAQIKRALRNGVDENKRSNTKVAFTGEAERIGTFEGTRWHATGCLSFWYYGALVMKVDFDHDMITDFGYQDYSMGTNMNIRGWSWELRRMRFIGMESLQINMPFNWTVCPHNNPNSPARPGKLKKHRDLLGLRFRMGSPWVIKRDGWPWLHAPSYDAAVVENGYRVIDEIFANSAGWRWFTADWVNGFWTKRFVSPEAEARWRAWQERAA